MVVSLTGNECNVSFHHNQNGQNVKMKLTGFDISFSCTISQKEEVSLQMCMIIIWFRRKLPIVFFFHRPWDEAETLIDIHHHYDDDKWNGLFYPTKLVFSCLFYSILFFFSCFFSHSHFHLFMKSDTVNIHL